MQEFFVDGPLPCLNDILAAANGHRMKGAALKKKWTEAVAWAAKAANLKPVEKAIFRFAWHELHRRRDPDNIMAGMKFVFDGLVMAKVLKNDGWGEVLLMEHAFCVTPERPGVMVTIYEPMER